MTELNSKSSPKQFFDIAPPGQSLPSATAKSVIVSNRPVLQDPMMLDTSTANQPEPAVNSERQPNVTVVPLRTSVVITASNDAKVSDLIEPESIQTEVTASETVPVAASNQTSNPVSTDEAPTIEASEDAALVEHTDNTSPEQSIDPTPEEASSSEQTVKSEVIEPSTDKIDDAAEAEAKHELAVQKLVETKQYFLPITTIEKQHSKRTVFLNIIIYLLLGLILLDVALDGGLIHIAGLKPLTHFFSN